MIKILLISLSLLQPVALKQVDKPTIVNCEAAYSYIQVYGLKAARERAKALGFTDKQIDAALDKCYRVHRKGN